MFETLMRIDYRRASIEPLVRAKSGAFGVNLLAPVIFAMILYGHVPLVLLAAVTVAQLLDYAYRVHIANKIINALETASKQELNRLLKHYLVTIFINSTLQGITGMLAIIYAEPIFVYVILMMIFAMTAGAMSTLTPVFHAVFLFVVMNLSIFTVSLIFIDSTYIYWLTALLTFSYIMVVVPSAFRIYQTITNNIQQREKVEEQNITFQHLLDTTMEAIILSDEDRNVIDINQSGLALFNIEKKEDVLGENLIAYVPKHAIPTIQKAMSNAVQAPYEMDLKKHGGEIFPALISSRDAVVDGKKVRIGTVMDLTQIKQKEQQLMQQSRLAQMGEMISMIAHQWRQPLAAISSTTNNLSFKIVMEDMDPDFFAKEVNLIAKYSQHLSKTIDDFRGFFKEHKESSTVTLEQIVEETIEIVKISAEYKGIMIETDFHSHRPITTYESELKQVVLNIIKNAEDVLVERKISHPTIKIKTLYHDNQYILSVEDNAGGVPEDIIGHIFSPYFSTKLEKDGTGLGLYMSKTIIEDHCGGKIMVENSAKGALFSIVLEPENK
jgi:PAS domain S-box-containing protein